MEARKILNKKTVLTPTFLALILMTAVTVVLAASLFSRPTTQSGVVVFARSFELYNELASTTKYLGTSTWSLSPGGPTGGNAQMALFYVKNTNSTTVYARWRIIDKPAWMSALVRIKHNTMSYVDWAPLADAFELTVGFNQPVQLYLWASAAAPEGAFNNLVIEFAGFRDGVETF